MSFIIPLSWGKYFLSNPLRVQFERYKSFRVDDNQFHACSNWNFPMHANILQPYSSQKLPYNHERHESLFYLRHLWMVRVRKGAIHGSCTLMPMRGGGGGGSNLHFFQTSSLGVFLDGRWGKWQGKMPRTWSQLCQIFRNLCRCWSISSVLTKEFVDVWPGHKY